MISRSYVNFPLMQQKRTLYRECYTCIHNLFFVSGVTVICASGGKWVGFLWEWMCQLTKLYEELSIPCVPEKVAPPKKKYPRIWHYIFNGPYSRKRNNCSPGISLTTNIFQTSTSTSTSRANFFCGNQVSFPEKKSVFLFRKRNVYS